MYFIFMYKLIEDVDVCEMRNGSLVKQKDDTGSFWESFIFFGDIISILTS